MLEIQNFFLSPGSAGGLIGAFLILSANSFRDMGLKGLTWRLRILFLFCGALAGALFHFHYGKEFDIFNCAVVGSGWPYVAVSFQRAAEAFSKGLRRHAGAAAREFMRSVLESKVENDNGE